MADDILFGIFVWLLVNLWALRLLHQSARRDAAYQEAVAVYLAKQMALQDERDALANGLEQEITRDESYRRWLARGSDTEN